MREDTKRWIAYAEENIKAAEILKENDLYNSSLHNIQQAVEKTLKAFLYVISKINFTCSATSTINGKMPINKDVCFFFSP